MVCTSSLSHFNNVISCGVTQRDHEELLREAENQQERSRRTIEELNASVAQLNARLREQEEALTSCKVMI